MGLKKFLFFYFLLFAGFAFQQLHAQLVVNPNVTSTQLMNNMIAQGLTVSNVQLNCTQGAYGTFNGSSSNLGITNGILLTTGNVSLAPGPNNSANIGANNQIQFSDPQLTGLVSNATYDPCILEFDVIPNCDSLEIRFVFGSEEYMEFVNRSFNDAFGFFITGPNPLGGNFNNTNIAWIPGTSTPVSVQNVNLNTNSSWYFDNGNGTGNGTAADGLTVQFDGFTKVMTVKIRLTPCASYHFKIAIADAGDHVVDSGVFIDYIGCGNLLSVNPSSTNSTSCIACNGTASVAVSGGSAPYTYSWSTGATTSNATGLCPGTYTVTIKDHNVCSNVAVQTFTIGGGNNLIFASTSETDIACGTTCSGIATVSVTGGTGPYNYQWLPSGGNTRTASNLCTGNYTVTVTDSQGCTLKQSFGITQNTITATQGQTNQGCNPNCVGAASIIVTQGTYPYTYQWSNGSGNWPGAFNLCAGVYTCTVTDAEGCKTTKTYTITSLPPIVFTKSQTDINCTSVCNGTATMSVTSGAPTITYSWYPGGQTTSSISNLCAGYYSVHVTDGNGCSVDEYYYITNGNALYLSPSQTNASCNGTCDGTATVTPHGGTPGYNYTWSTGATTATATGLCQGTYTCTVNDMGGCTERYVFYIYQEYPPNVYVNATGAACNGTCNGTAAANAYGGSGNYTYSWSSLGATTSTVTGLCTGNYTVTITDPASGCTAQSAFSITQAQPPYVYVYTTDAACNGTCTGTATSNVYGGAQPYQYSWSPSGGTNASASGYCIGNFTLTVTDAGGCSVNYPFSINQAQPPYIYPQQTDVSCHGGCDATAQVQVYGGVAPYRYQWLPSGGTNSSATGLCVGTYSCSITDSIGCNIVQVFNIVQAPTLIINPYQQNPSCGGVCDAYASAYVQGGIPQYTYSWSNNTSFSSIYSVCAGVYTLTVTDAAGCTAVKTYTLTDPVPIAINMNKLNISCNGLTDGVITASVTGGTGFYYYYWSNNQYTPTVSPLAAGTYTVTVYDSNGCTKSDTATIIDPPQLLAGGSSTPVSCIAATGTATGFAIGGTPTFSYSWSNGRTGPTITGLNAGIYTVTVTDSRGCKNSNAINVINSGGPRAYIVGFTDPLCSNSLDGTATASAVGGLPPYTYSWNNSQTNATATGLTAGTYTVFVTDIFGCGSTDTVRLSQPPPLFANANSTSATCGTNNGTASVSPNGGTPGYFYLWDNSQTISSVSGLGAGVYSVTVSDSHGCPIVATATVTNANGPNIIFGTTNVSCSGGTNGIITTTVSGAGPFTYSWSNTQTTPSISSLTAALYSVTVSDPGGCTSTANVNVTEPTAITSTLTATDASCGLSNGTITTVVSGGVSNYNYNWSNTQTSSSATGLSAAVYSLTITDVNGCTAVATSTVNNTSGPAITFGSSDVSCNGAADGIITTTITGANPFTYSWSNAQTSSSISSLAANNYSLTVTDAGGCTATGSITITEPSVISNTVIVNDAACGSANGDAAINVSGGVAPYNYNWSNGQTTAMATALVAGQYSVTITDANGCSLVATAAVNNSNGPVIAFSVVDVTCNGSANGIITTTLSGGGGSNTYAWSNAQTTSNISSLVAGSYSLTVTDGAGCTTTANMIITEPAVISSTLTVGDETCGLANGSIIANVNGGASPYNYNWSNTQTTSSLTGLGAAIYSLTITDMNGCTSVASSTVNATSGPLIVFNTTDVSCNGGSNGIITAVPNGGNGPYAFVWSNSQTSATISSLAAGSYSIIVTDASGCTSVANTTITEPSSISMTVTPVDASCGLSDGSASSAVSGGNGPYNYLWSNGSTLSSASLLAAGNYTLTVTDNNGCSTFSTTVISNSNGPILNVSSQQDVSCNGGSNGSANISTINGSQPYSFLWNNNQTDSIATNLAAGVYTLTVTDAGGCTNTINVNITEPTALGLGINTTNASCGNTGTATANVNGGTAAYNYLWSNAATDNSISNLGQGVYSLTVTDANGCSTVNSGTVNLSGGLTLNPISQPVTCYGNTNGAAGVNASGGNGPYTYVWNTSETNVAITGLAAGAYTVEVTDAGGCTGNLTVTITEPNAISIVTSGTVIVCNGQNATLTAMANGGTAAYLYQWNPGALPGSSVNVLATTNATYIVTVTDANGCTAIDSSVVVVNNAPQGNFTASDSTGCEPLCAVFNHSVANVNSLAWDFGDGNSSSQTAPVHCYTLAGVYSVSLSITDNNGCTASFIKNNYINVYANPVAAFSASPQQTSILNPIIQVTDQSQGANQWQWNFGDEINGTSTLQNVSYIYGDTGTFEISLIVTSVNNCVDTAYASINILPDYILYVPNSFTPNGDGVNDFFFPKGMGIGMNTYHFYIYDRWGQKIFESSDFNKGWDGKVKGENAQIDVYIWKIEAEDLFSQPHQYTGHVSLIR